DLPALLTGLDVDRGERSPRRRVAGRAERRRQEVSLERVGRALLRLVAELGRAVGELFVELRARDEPDVGGEPDRVDDEHAALGVDAAAAPVRAADHARKLDRALERGRREDALRARARDQV